MPTDKPHLDEKLNTYRAAVDEWVDAIREEESLASGNHDLLEVDRWEKAAFREEELRKKAKKAKQAYEDAIRKDTFGF